MIELGVKVRDRVTGFSGTVTGLVSYITGCNQALVAPTIGEDGAMRDSQWIDEQRLEDLGGERLILDNSAANGPDKAPPKR